MIDNLGESVHDARAAQILVVSLSKAGEKGHRIRIYVKSLSQEMQLTLCAL